MPIVPVKLSRRERAEVAYWAASVRKLPDPLGGTVTDEVVMRGAMYYAVRWAVEITRTRGVDRARELIWSASDDCDEITYLALHPRAAAALTSEWLAFAGPVRRRLTRDTRIGTAAARLISSGSRQLLALQAVDPGAVNVYWSNHLAVDQEEAAGRLDPDAELCRRAA